jgi:hypothetical protein
MLLGDIPPEDTITVPVNLRLHGYMYYCMTNRSWFHLATIFSLFHPGVATPPSAFAFQGRRRQCEALGVGGAQQ